MNIKQKLFIVSVFIVEIISILQWVRCQIFTAHFSTLDLSLRLIESIHSDTGVSILETRIFHNKILYVLLDTFNIYLRYLNISFLTMFLSIAGVFGLSVGIYYFLRSKKKPLFSWILLVLLFLTPLLEGFNLLQTYFVIKLIILTIPFILWSLYGYYRLLEKPNKKIYGVIILLLVLSIWFITNGGQNFKDFCEL